MCYNIFQEKAPLIFQGPQPSRARLGITCGKTGGGSFNGCGWGTSGGRQPLKEDFPSFSKPAEISLPLLEALKRTGEAGFF